MSIHQFNFKNIVGEEVSFKSFEGKVVLIVNTASNCGLTYHYKGLEDLYQEYKDAGLEIIGFPCNQFLRQDPGSNDEILEFCQLNFGVTFPMFSKINVNGKNRSELYSYLIDNSPVNKGAKIKWNFEKILIDEQGHVFARFRSAIKPDSKKIISLF